MAHADGFAGDHGMNQRLGPLTCFAALAMLAALSSDALALARPKPIQHAGKADAASKAGHHREAARKKDKHAATARSKPAPSVDAPPQSAGPPLSADLAAAKQAIDLVRKAKTSEATVVEKTINEPAAQKLVEWFILRHPDGAANFSRYAAFIADNPNWPGVGQLRRRAEACLWQERSDAATVHRFTGDQPTSRPCISSSTHLAAHLSIHFDRSGTFARPVVDLETCFLRRKERIHPPDTYRIHFQVLARKKVARTFPEPRVDSLAHREIAAAAALAPAFARAARPAQGA